MIYKRYKYKVIIKIYRLFTYKKLLIIKNLKIDFKYFYFKF